MAENASIICAKASGDFKNSSSILLSKFFTLRILFALLYLTH